MLGLGLGLNKNHSTAKKYKNAITNGNFINGSSGWIADWTADISVSNGILSVTGKGNNSFVSAYSDASISCSDGKKIYISYKARTTNAITSSFRTDAKGLTSGVMYSLVSKNTPSEGVEYTLSKIVTLSGLAGVFRIFPTHIYADAAAASGKVMQIREFIAYDLTANGLDSKDLAWCDANIPQNIQW